MKWKTLFICTIVKNKNQNQQDFSIWQYKIKHSSWSCWTPHCLQCSSPQCQPRAATGHGSTALLPAGLLLLGLQPKMSCGHRADEHFCRKHLPEVLGLKSERGLHLSVPPDYFVKGTRKHLALKIHTFSSNISASTAGNHECYLSSKCREKQFSTQITFINPAAEYFITSAISKSYCRAQKEQQCQ